MPRPRKSAAKPKRGPLKRKMRKGGLRRRVPIITNTAAVRENYTVSLNDGSMTYFSVNMGNPIFDRAQAIAENFQEYRIKYVKLIFKPSADTFPIAAGNTIPQLYFQMNKYQAIATGTTLQNLLDMGCRPIRFDDKNIVRAWKPIVLLGADNTNPTTLATTSAAKVTPWLSTNGFAGQPGNWTPSDIEHLGCVFIVTKPNPATPTISYNVDVEVVFQFRRPLSLVSGSHQPYQVVKGGTVTQYDVSGNQVVQV